MVKRRGANKQGVKNPTQNRGRGRPKGSPNKLTRQVKEAIYQAFQGVGAQRYLRRVAREDPRVFCTLLGKLVPHEVSGSIGLNSHEEALDELERRLQGG